MTFTHDTPSTKITEVHHVNKWNPQIHTVDEMIAALQAISDDGKGDYSLIFVDSRGDYIYIDDVDDTEKAVYLSNDLSNW